MIMQKKMGVYHGYDVWMFDTNKPVTIGYPVFALTKGRKVWTIKKWHKYHRRIWDYVNSLPDDDDEEDDDDIDID